MTDIETEMEIALAGDPLMHELLDALKGNPFMQKVARQAFRSGFSSGALAATIRAAELVRTGGKP